MRKPSLILIALCLLLASCGKPENEWNRFSGFTKEDIAGHYEANPDESLYEPLPTEGVTVYNNAVVDVEALAGSSVSVRISIPGAFHLKSFSGPINADSDLTLTNAISSNTKEDIMMTVYRNEAGQVRFHGRVKRYHYSTQPGHENELTSSENWGFDVIKQ